VGHDRELKGVCLGKNWWGKPTENKKKKKRLGVIKENCVLERSTVQKKGLKELIMGRGTSNCQKWGPGINVQVLGEKDA